jgi:hypothetical protein
MQSSLSPAARRSVQVLGALGIALICAAMLYALHIGWINYARIGV